tara:strand:- start:318 stop:491 length:174 start_codon:yes stop_codon:yes gene_type:complete
VKPRSTDAEEQFNLYMNRLHSCRVTKEDRYTYFLSSITNKFSFELNKEFDKNWEVIK